MGVIISFGVVLIISVTIGLVARWLRNLQQNEEYRQAEARAKDRNESNSESSESPRSAPKSATAEMERFLDEINKLRNRTPGAPAQPRPVATPISSPPVAEAALRSNAIETPPLMSPPVVTPPTQLNETVTVVPYSRSNPSLNPAVVKPVVAKPLPVAKPVGVAEQPDRRKKPELTQQLVQLIRSGNGPALAILLNEVLGKPKCKRSE